MSYALGDVRRGTDDAADPPGSGWPASAPSDPGEPMPTSPPIYAGGPAPQYDEPGVDDPVPSDPSSPGGGWFPRTSPGGGGGPEQASMGMTTASWLLVGVVVAAGIFAWRSR